MQIDELNERFGIPGVLQVTAGNGGLPKLSVTAQESAAEIYLHGAQVTSWRPVGADDVIFLSERSHWEDGRAIRGGIPVCFPWFRGKAEDAKAPAHGVVRTKAWQLQSAKKLADGSVSLICTIESDEHTRRWWPHEFQLVHRINVGKSLRMQLIAANTGSDAFRFEEALHTYFRVGDVEQARLRGLESVSYLDNTDENREKKQNGPVILSAPTDNAYLGTQSAVDVVDPVLRRVIRTEKENSTTTIVWNPWQLGAAKLSDLGDEEWHQMICVEGSNILNSAISLQPGEQHSMSVTLSVVAD